MPRTGGRHYPEMGNRGCIGTDNVSSIRNVVYMSLNNINKIQLF